MKAVGRALAGAVVAVGAALVPPAVAVADHPAGSVPPAEWACPAGQVPEDGFVDVPPTNVHEPAVDCAVWRELVSGTGPGTYAPDAPVTRGQMATFAVRLIELNVGLSGAAPDAFDDDDDSVHETAINKLAGAGLIAGTGPREYSPTAPVSRSQVATYLVRVYERLRSVELPAARDHFVDDDESVHERSIDRAASMRLLSGVSPTAYEPDAPVRRDQMARFLTAARGCTGSWRLDGTWHDALCDSYTDSEGPQALQGFELTVTTDAVHHTIGEPVAVTIQACNRRTTPLRQVFPQRDWFVLEARHEQLSPQDTWTQREWYDHRYQPSLNGSGYGERDMYDIYPRISARHPRTVALTWYDGPQGGADDVVVWEPGECKSLDVGAWQQMDKIRSEVDPDDYPAHWRHRSDFAPGRATPGWYALHLNWGGVETDQTRRYLVVDSPRFNLDGPRVSAVFDDVRHYDADEPVPVTATACNDSDRPYSEYIGQRDVTGDPAILAVGITGNFDNGGDSVGVVTVADRDVTWAPGECRTWRFTWDQRIGDRFREPGEQFALWVSWNQESDERAQGWSGPYTYLQ